jgi:hypothetical protein
MAAYLLQADQLSPHYRQALASCYFRYARERLLVNYREYQQLVEDAIAVDPSFRVESHRRLKQWVQRLLGFRLTEQLAAWAILFRANSLEPNKMS